MNAPKLSIYVADLVAYNAGRLEGGWVHVTEHDDADILRVAAQDAANGHEWRIDNSEGWGELDPSRLTVSELVAVSNMVREHGPAVLPYCADVGVEYGLESFEEAYAGEWEDTEEFAGQLSDDLLGLPENHPGYRYFDLDAFTRDLFMGDYTAHAAEGGGVYVFRSL